MTKKFEEKGYTGKKKDQMLSKLERFRKEKPELALDLVQKHSLTMYGLDSPMPAAALFVDAAKAIQEKENGQTHNFDTSFVSQQSFGSCETKEETRCQEKEGEKTPPIIRRSSGRTPNTKRKAARSKPKASERQQTLKEYKQKKQAAAAAAAAKKKTSWNGSRTERFNKITNFR